MLDSQSSQLILLGKSPFLLLHSERRSAALIELRLLCALSFVSAPSRYEIRRADQLVQVDYMPVVELDIRASKTDDLRDWSGTNLELKSCFFGRGALLRVYWGAGRTRTHELRLSPTSRHAWVQQRCSDESPTLGYDSRNGRLWKGKRLLPSMSCD